MTTPRLELIDEKTGSRKFWQAIDGVVRFGRIGETPGRCASQHSDTVKVYCSKLRKGYVPILIDGEHYDVDKFGRYLAPKPERNNEH